MCGRIAEQLNDIIYLQALNNNFIHPLCSSVSLERRAFGAGVRAPKECSVKIVLTLSMRCPDAKRESLKWTRGGFFLTKKFIVIHQETVLLCVNAGLTSNNDPLIVHLKCQYDLY